MLSTRWVYTLISCSVRLICILLLINPGSFRIVVAPARRCPGSFYIIFAVIHSWPAAMSAICIEHVVCERITLLSFALYYPVRSLSGYISTYPRYYFVQQSVCLVMLSCLSCQKECTNIQASSESPLKVWILTTRVGTPCPCLLYTSPSPRD